MTTDKDTSILFTIPGRPVPAVRMTQRSKWTKQAQRYLQYKEIVAWAAKEANIQKIVGAVEVCAIAYLYGKREPDVDNLGKSWLDGLNGVAWGDDKQVRVLTVAKVKVESKAEERAVISIRESCLDCVWLQNRKVCPFQRCIRKNGWSVDQKS